MMKLSTPIALLAFLYSGTSWSALTIVSPTKGQAITSDQKLSVTGACNAKSTSVTIGGGVAKKISATCNGSYSAPLTFSAGSGKKTILVSQTVNGVTSSVSTSINYTEVATEVITGCDCGSVDVTKPCIGKSISFQVTASTPKRITNAPVTFNYNFMSSGGGGAYCGQFANGDYWIAPKAGQSVVVTSISQSGGLGVAAELDPADPSATGLLGKNYNYGNYVADKDLVSKLPVTITTDRNHVLVSAIERNQAVQGNCGTSAITKGCVDAYHFLSFLPSVPANLGADLIRPSIAGGHAKLYSLSDFNFNRLPSLSGLKPKSLALFDEIRRRWAGAFELEYSFSEGGRAFRPHLILDDYSSGVSVAWHDSVAAVIASEYTFEEKKAALASMLTYAKDNYFVFHAPEGPQSPMGGGAGQSQGKYPTIVFFATLVKNPEIAASIAQIAQRPYGDGVTRSYRPVELEQVHSGPHGLVWGDASPEGEKRYWSDLFSGSCFDGATGVCGQNLGKKTSMDPYGFVDGPAENPGEFYMTIGGGAILNIATEMFLMPAMCDVIGTDILYKYVDQKISSGIQVLNDPCAPPDPRESANCAPYYDGTRTPTNCTYYKVTWGPNPAKPGTCIQNAPGQNGRYSNLAGKAAKFSYNPLDFTSAKYLSYKGSKSSCVSKPAGVTFVKTSAALNLTTKKLTWSHPTNWSDGSAFDSSKYLGWYKISYTNTLTGQSQSVTTQGTSWDVLNAKDISISACDHINRCQQMVIQ